MHCMMVSKISKHLMLLFNDTIRERTEKMVSFQNISCYCLTAKSQEEAGVAL